ncbi:MAG: hypothetical protein HN952_06250 [Candidatus Cloacimonetes bacterium]|nr:hypothetical protein [Candidatus Cloacimonadota bacterium]
MKPILREADAETLAILQAIDIDELRGISNQVAKSVKTQLQTVVMSGVAFDKAVEKVMTSSDKLTQYASTYMNTSRSMLSQKVSDLSAENYKEEGGVVYWEYFGALPDEKTRDECLMGLGVQPSGSYPNAPFFTDDEKIGFQSEFGIRWNCRHEFNQITEDYYEEMTGNSAKNISEYDEGVFNQYKELLND